MKFACPFFIIISSFRQTGPALKDLIKGHLHMAVTQGQEAERGGAVFKQC